MICFAVATPVCSADPAPAGQALAPNYALPVPWNEIDIGAVSPAGSAGIDGGVYTITSGGVDIGGRADNFAFVYQGATGDFAFTARVVRLICADPDAKAGVMARDALAASTNFTASLVTADHRAERVYRPYYSPIAVIDTAATNAPSWVKLIYRGGQIDSYVAPDSGGAPSGWVRIGSETPASTGLVYIGLVSVSHSAAALCTAVFDHVSLEYGQQPILPDGLYALMPASAPELVLDGAGPVSSGNPVAIIQTSTNASSQKWNLVNKGNGVYDVQYAPDKTLALSIDGTAYQNCDKIILAPDRGAANQLWSIAANANGTFGLYSTGASASGIGDNGGSRVPGFPMVLYKASAADQHMQWIIVPAQ